MHTPAITAATLRARLDGLAPIGVGPDGVRRLAWTAEDAATGQWFAAQGADCGLSCRRDLAGNLWACPSAPAPWWAVGSHLDSVRGGGAYDGPLGVACGFEIARVAAVPVAVISFADEEGARFNTPTFGSKALTGRLDVPAILERSDELGVTLRDAIAGAGVDPGRLADAPSSLSDLRGFCEIHIDQSTEVARAHVPMSVVSALAARMRLEVELRGRADHAGTTPREERRDALGTAARLIVAAEELGAGLTVTTARIEVEPNAATTIAARVKLWIDGRGSDPGRLEDWRAALERRADQLGESTGVDIALGVASRSGGTSFDPGLRGRLHACAARVLGREVPDQVCYAGHDAGVLAERVPAAMVLVRNPTGISHSPAEAVALEDAAVAAQVMAVALEDAAAAPGGAPTVTESPS